MEIDTSTTELLCSVLDGVALITLNWPEARNATLGLTIPPRILARADEVIE